MIVCKFGGTSVACLDTAKKIKEIVNANENRKIIVVSALGKSENCDYKITDKLFELYFAIINNEEYLTIINEIIGRYKELSNALNVNLDWEYLRYRFINKIKNGNISKAYIVSRGEYFSAILFAKYLNIEFLDASKYIIFNKNGKIDKKNTKNRLKKLNLNRKCVIGGYYGAKIDGEVCLFDRGGSDITGAIICKMLNFEVYENYTDVCGVFDKNPNVFSSFKHLPLISYRTAISMANGGNEVVHGKALIELKGSDSLLSVKSTKDYERLGTIIIDNNEIINDNLCVCTSEIVVAQFSNLLMEQLSLLKRHVNIYKIIKIKKIYYVLIKNIQMKESCLKKIFNPIVIYAARVFTIFSDIKIRGTYLKQIKKIERKLKKHNIICANLAKNNNFCIISCEECSEVVINILNEYLQNK